MSTVLPSNEECYRLYYEEGRHGSKELIVRLLAHSKGRGLLERRFEKNFRHQFHELFWELYLAAALDQVGFYLQRGKHDSPEPDFLSLIGEGKPTIFLEAVACSNPTEPGNRVPSPSQEEESDFEEGFAPSGKIAQRIAQAIDSKIANLTRPTALTAMQRPGNYYAVIAVNGCRALNGHPHNNPGLPFLPFVGQALFGAVEQRVNQAGQTVWTTSDRMRKSPADGASFPVGHFSKPTWETKNPKTKAKVTVSTTHIAGVLYSQVSAEDTAPPLGYDFVYFQNPHGPDATPIFKFCQGGVWIKEGQELIRFA